MVEDYSDEDEEEAELSPGRAEDVGRIIARRIMKIGSDAFCTPHRIAYKAFDKVGNEVELGGLCEDALANVIIGCLQEIADDVIDDIDD